MRPSEQGVREANPPYVSPRRDGEGNQVPKRMTLYCREKLLTSSGAPVPQTDTGRWGEKPQAREKTLVKELGKMTP